MFVLNSGFSGHFVNQGSNALLTVHCGFRPLNRLITLSCE